MNAQQSNPQAIDQIALEDALQKIEKDRPDPIAVSNQGVIYRLELQGQDLAVKTLPLRTRISFVHQRTLQQEFKAYRALEGLAGFPVCYGLFDRRWLVLDWIEGRAFRDVDLSREDGFFTQLLDTIEFMHQRGVAHGDLKRKANLIVQSDGTPMVLDLGAAVIKKTGFHPVNHRTFEFIRQTDINAWVKLKYGGYTGLSSEDQQRLKRSGIERMLSYFRAR